VCFWKKKNIIAFIFELFFLIYVSGKKRERELLSLRDETMGTKGKGYSSIEIVDNFFKSASVRLEAGSVSLSGVIEKELSDQKEETITKAIEQLCSNRQTLPFLLLLPRKLSTVRYIEVPSIDKKEIDNIVGFQAIRQVPFSLEEIIVDYQILEISPQGYTKIMLVIVHRDVIQKYLRILHGAQIYPEKILLNTQAISQAGEFFWGEKKEKSEAVGILDIDYRVINFVVNEKGIFKYSRSVSWDGNNCDTIVSEVERSIGDCNSENIKLKLARLLLFGANAEKIIIVKKQLEEKIKIPIAEIKVEKSLQGEKSSLLGLLGATKSQKETMNFLPRPIINKRSQRRKIKKYMTCALLISLILASVCGSFLGKIMVRKKYLKALNQKLEAIEPKAVRIEAMQKKVRIIEKELNITASPLDILKDVYAIFPSDVSLTTLAYDKGNTLVLKGLAKEMSDVFDLIPKLEKSVYLENVISKYATKRKIEREELIDFQLQCGIVEKESFVRATVKVPQKQKES